jgi:branched-chain amino acid transport system substrate-binding protein
MCLLHPTGQGEDRELLCPVRLSLCEPLRDACEFASHFIPRTSTRRGILIMHIRSLTCSRALAATAAAALLVAAAAACSSSKSASAVGGGGSGGGSDKGDITIGEISDLTGANGPLGAEAHIGVQLAVDQINASGGVLGGRKLRVLSKDDATAPDQAVVALRALKDQHVAGIIGPTFTLSALAAIPQADQAGIPYLSTAAGDQQLQTVRPGTFVVTPVAKLSAQRLASYFQANGVTKVAMAYDTKNGYTQAGQAAFKEVAAQAGITIVDTEQFETGANDFGPLLAHVKSSGAQAFVAWAVGAPAVLLAKQYHTAGITSQLVFSLAEATPLFLQPAGAAAEGALIVTSPDLFPDAIPDSPAKTAITSVADAYQAKYGHGPSEFVYDGYDSVRILAAAIDKAGSTDPAKVRTALAGLDVELAHGKFAFTATDHQGLSADSLTVGQVKDGALVPTDWARQQLAGFGK